MKQTILIAIFTFFVCCSFTQHQSILADEFEKRLIEANGEQLIDVRTPQEFEKYRITGAKNINFRSADFRQEIEKLDKNKPVLIYCLAGPRSKSALAVFQKAGFKTVYELDGGINAWSKAGKSIDQDLSGKGEISAKEYDAVTSGKGYVLVDFYAPWCAPCRKMLPVVEDLAKTYPGKFKLLTVDFDKNRLLVNEKRVSSVPYLIVFKDGKKTWEKSGEASKEELMKILKLQ
ncbi:MAG: thioredoxin fold domain-containing protein [Prevotellaceae bacterium]|jgi:thioredoxin|nr:thioredoxin fold domain-containing protein [Prevotellaceae bacterium]